MPLSHFLSSQLRNAAPRKKRGTKRELTGEEEAGIISDIASQSAGAVCHSVRLKSGGFVSVTITANPFSMPVEDREFVFSMIDMVQKYETEHKEEGQ